MSPATGPTFENRVRRGLAGLLKDAGAEVVVDHIDEVESQGVLLVDFHLEGAWASPAGFSFPFHESVSLDHSLSAMRDMVSKNWQRAHLAPPVAPPGTFNQIQKDLNRPPRVSP